MSFISKIKKNIKLLLPKSFKKRIKCYLIKTFISDYIHKTYGKVYMPIYNMDVPLNNKYPEVYNSDGKKMEFYFLRDIHGAHLVYGYNKYFEWDRYNFGLDTHFYTGRIFFEVRKERGIETAS
jgi:hypothetical protein